MTFQEKVTAIVKMASYPLTVSAERKENDRREQGRTQRMSSLYIRLPDGLTDDHYPMKCGTAMKGRKAAITGVL